MNFIILNGKKSTEVAGLMIQSLPPVVKPPMRVQLDEVDGRDGDIITPLGFSGYDRTVKIGLRGVYDEDDIVQYFNSSGKVIFSNEPDKVYDYIIAESFSLDRLRRFREADVVFHVQPYKYSVVPEINIPAEVVSNCAIPKLPFAMDRSANWYEWDYDDGVFTFSCEKGDHLEWYQGGVKKYRPPFPEPNTYQMANPAMILPGTYDIYLTVESGEIVDGGLLFGLTGTKTISANEIIAGYEMGYTTPCVIVDEPGTYHVTLTATEPFVADSVYIRIVFGHNEDENHDFWAIIQNLVFSDLQINASTAGTAGVAVTNRGNTVSAPIYTIQGALNCSFKVNNNDPVVISASEATDLVIDTEKMQAYSGSTLKNRLCSGNYANLHLQPGINTISMTGTFTGFIVSNYSRWI